MDGTNPKRFVDGGPYINHLLGILPEKCPNVTSSKHLKTNLSNANLADGPIIMRIRSMEWTPTFTPSTARGLRQRWTPRLQAFRQLSARSGATSNLKALRGEGLRSCGVPLCGKTRCGAWPKPGS